VYSVVVNERDDWQQLCRAAASEKDPEKLLTLVDRINQLLERRERETRQNQQNPVSPHGPPDRPV
jgi:hypothetical protein